MTQRPRAGAAAGEGAAAGAIWFLDAGQCIGCGICADICQSEAIVMTRAMALPEPVPGACTGCLECEWECPTGAITVHSAPDQAV